MSADFSMRENSLSRTMPTQLGRLRKLGVGLDLDKNSLTGSVPTELGSMSVLSGHAYLSFNEITSTLPTQVCEDERVELRCYELA